ncbi:MAG: shikimate kinase [Candidatus Omnitrophica bacterium]|jgi:Shikimate kinase|nr:shikimate kinase [Candidatus Omnitrophota bacterium]
MKNIALVGFMGTGKTTVAQETARILHAGYVDLDDCIEKREGLAIVDIFKKKGEAYFRSVEKSVVRDIAGKPGHVIACGGGVMLDPDNIEALKQTGVVICLEATPEIILERTRAYAHRPLLNVPDPKATIEELLNKRRPFYAQADYTIDTSALTVDTVVEKIVTWTKGKI